MKPNGNSGKGINDSANKLQRATQNNDSKKIEKHLGRAENSTDQIFDKNSRRLEKNFSKIDRHSENLEVTQNLFLGAPNDDNDDEVNQLIYGALPEAPTGAIKTGTGRQSSVENLEKRFKALATTPMEKLKADLITAKTPEQKNIIFRKMQQLQKKQIAEEKGLKAEQDEAEKKYGKLPNVPTGDPFLSLPQNPQSTKIKTPSELEIDEFAMEESLKDVNILSVLQNLQSPKETTTSSKPDDKKNIATDQNQTQSESFFGGLLKLASKLVFQAFKSVVNFTVNFFSEKKGVQNLITKNPETRQSKDILGSSSASTNIEKQLTQNPINDLSGQPKSSTSPIKAYNLAQQEKEKNPENSKGNGPLL